jgi:hypothetical protein
MIYWVSLPVRKPYGSPPLHFYVKWKTSFTPHHTPRIATPRIAIDYGRIDPIYLRTTSPLPDSPTSFSIGIIVDWA